LIIFSTSLLACLLEAKVLNACLSSKLISPGLWALRVADPEPSEEIILSPYIMPSSNNLGASPEEMRGPALESISR